MENKIALVLTERRGQLQEILQKKMTSSEEVRRLRMERIKQREEERKSMEKSELEGPQLQEVKQSQGLGKEKEGWLERMTKASKHLRKLREQLARKLSERELREENKPRRDRIKQRVEIMREELRENTEKRELEVPQIREEVEWLERDAKAAEQLRRVKELAGKLRERKLREEKKPRREKLKQRVEKMREELKVSMEKSELDVPQFLSQLTS